MRKTLAAIVSAAMIGCASPEPDQTTLQPGEQVLRPATPDTRELVLTFYEQVLNASDVSRQNHEGHVTNLHALEAKIREVKKITPDMPADEQVRRIHNYLFDRNPHRVVREGEAGAIFDLAQPQRIIAYDLQDGARRAGSELGLALQYFILSARFGHEVTPHLITRNNEKHIIFIYGRTAIDVTDPFGVKDAPENAGERLTPANLLGLLLNTKGARQIMSGNPEDAYKTYDRAYQLYPTADITLNLGETAVLLGNIPLARQWFQQTTRLDEKGHVAHERLGELSFVENNFEAAEQHYMRALERCETKGILYAQYGETLFMLNRRTEAARFFKRALELEQHDQELRSGIERYLAECTTRK